MTLFEGHSTCVHTNSYTYNGIQLILTISACSEGWNRMIVTYVCSGCLIIQTQERLQEKLGEWWQYLLTLWLIHAFGWKVLRCKCAFTHTVSTALLQPLVVIQSLQKHISNEMYLLQVFLQNQSYTTCSWSAINPGFAVVFTSHSRQW